MKRPSLRFHASTVGRAEMEAVQRALDRGQLGGNGPVGARVELALAKRIGAKRAFLVPSGTAALELALMSLGLGPGDEVILPSFTFVSDATAVLRQGATPVFADVDPRTLCLDPADAARRVTRRTRALILVHYAGLACDMDAFLRLRHRHRLALVEDAALALGASWRGRPLGGLGDLGCFSFHATKQVTCGEGGALLTSRSDLVRRIEVMREKGTDRGAFLRGERDRYTWRDQGSSFVLSDLLAAMLEIQLRREPKVRLRLLRLWNAYHQFLAPAQRAGRLRLPDPLPAAGRNGHLFWFALEGAWRGRRRRFLAQLQRRGVPAAFHYVPLHSSPFGRKLLRGRQARLTATERIAADLVRLPLHARMRLEDCREVARIVVGLLGTDPR